jgi:hypothetical protein
MNFDKLARATPTPRPRPTDPGNDVLPAHREESLNYRGRLIHNKLSLWRLIRSFRTLPDTA